MRVTQRAPRSCVQCTSKKMRCSKQIPCDNCRERGMGGQCHRESVVLTYHHPRSTGRVHRHRIRHRDSSRHLQSNPNYQMRGQPIRQPKINPPQDVYSPPACGNNVGYLGDEHDAVTNAAARQEVVQFTSMTARAPSRRRNSDTPRDNSLAVEAAMTLETLAWGRYGDITQQVPGSAQVFHISRALNDILSPQQIQQILEFHKIHVAWMHNVIHMPSFIQSCGRPLLEHISKDSAWLSLYHAVLCTGLYYMNEDQHRELGLLDGYEVCEKLYRLTINAITNSDFMATQSISSLQAICVILTCAHSFGDSKRIIVLLASAVGISQSLHFHRIGTAPPISTDFNALIDHELRKRIWCFLCVQDWYLIASKRSYLISPNHSTTPLPANMSDDGSCTASNGIHDLPLSTPTQSTYTLFLFKHCSLFRSLHDRLCDLETRNGTVSDLFDEVLATDSQLEKLTRQLPRWTLQQEPADPNWPPCALWQRRTFLIMCWHQRLMIHRTFFCRSFEDKRYYYSRAVSLQAAHSILSEYHDYVNQYTVDIWTIPAHVISSCFILALNMLFCDDIAASEGEDMVLMRKCLDILRGMRRPCAILQRGLVVIDYLLKQESGQGFRALDFKEIDRLIRDVNPKSSLRSRYVDDPSGLHPAEQGLSLGQVDQNENFDTLPELYTDSAFDDILGPYPSQSLLQHFTW